MRLAPATDLAPEQAAEAIEWVIAAGRPYVPWLLGDENRVHAFVSEQLRDSRSEYALSRTRWVMLHGRVAGGFIALSGDEMHQARLHDVTRMIARLPADERPGLAERFRESKHLFAPVEPATFYLSKIGVIERERGRGIGSFLLEAFVSDGRARGFRSFRLDVAESNAGARALYTKHGFEPVARGVCASLGQAYLAMQRQDD